MGCCKTPVEQLNYTASLGVSLNLYNWFNQERVRKTKLNFPGVSCILSHISKDGNQKVRFLESARIKVSPLIFISPPLTNTYSDTHIILWSVTRRSAFQVFGCSIVSRLGDWRRLAHPLSSCCLQLISACLHWMSRMVWRSEKTTLKKVVI